jgi:hypothetical protein
MDITVDIMVATIITGTEIIIITTIITTAEEEVQHMLQTVTDMEDVLHTIQTAAEETILHTLQIRLQEIVTLMAIPDLLQQVQEIQIIAQDPTQILATTLTLNKASQQETIQILNHNRNHHLVATLRLQPVHPLQVAEVIAAEAAVAVEEDRQAVAEEGDKET